MYLPSYSTLSNLHLHSLSRRGNPYENGFQEEPESQVTSPPNNLCPSARDPELSWGSLYGKVRGLPANPNIADRIFVNKGFLKNSCQNDSHLRKSRFRHKFMKQMTQRQRDRRCPGTSVRGGSVGTMFFYLPVSFQLLLKASNLVSYFLPQSQRECGELGHPGQASVSTRDGPCRTAAHRNCL